MNLHSMLRPEVVIAALLASDAHARRGVLSRIHGHAGQKAAQGISAGEPLAVVRALCADRNFILNFSLELAGGVCIAASGHGDPPEPGEDRRPWQDGQLARLLILIVLGPAVDLRWFEPAWPAGLTALGKMLLLDAGIFGFLVVRQLDGVGFDLRLKWRDLLIGLREFCLYAPIAIFLGLSLGFLHFHASWPAPLPALGAYVFTFFFIAIPEELFFRGWLQNLLERRLGRTAALMTTAVLFGLAHWNKRTTSFNWQYVLLAALAGIFYGRAWRAYRRVGASAVTHATVDTLWSLWLR